MCSSDLPGHCGKRDRPQEPSRSPGLAGAAHPPPPPGAARSARPEQERRAALGAPSPPRRPHGASAWGRPAPRGRRPAVPPRPGPRRRSAARTSAPRRTPRQLQVTEGTDCFRGCPPPSRATTGCLLRAGRAGTAHAHCRASVRARRAPAGGERAGATRSGRRARPCAVLGGCGSGRAGFSVGAGRRGCGAAGPRAGRTGARGGARSRRTGGDRKSTRLNSSH